MPLFKRVAARKLPNGAGLAGLVRMKDIDRFYLVDYIKNSAPQASHRYIISDEPGNNYFKTRPNGVSGGGSQQLSGLEKGRNMKFGYCVIMGLIFLMVLASGSYGDNPAVAFRGAGIDRDTMTASDYHRLLAAGKADALQKHYDAQKTRLPSLYDQTEYDVTYYKLDMKINVDSQYIWNAVTVAARSTVVGLDTIALDFIDSIPEPQFYPDSVFTKVDSVVSGAGILAFEHHDDQLIVELDRLYDTDEEFVFTVYYHGHPYSEYRYDFGPDYRMSGEGLAFGRQMSLLGGTSMIPVAYSSCEPYTSRWWWPCKDRPDDKADSLDMVITTWTPFYASGNGVLIDHTINHDGTNTFNYSMRYPVVTYLVAVSISQFTVYTDWYHYGDNDSMPIVNHVYPELYDSAFADLAITPYAIGVYADIYGEYPFINEKYGHAMWEAYSAMEHQTVTSTTGDPWGTSEPVVVHELSHHWWGDMITCESWQDIWLNEGFASYSEALYYEAKDGRQALHSYMATMNYDDSLSVYVYDTTQASDVFNIVVYDKGAWVLHMLRHIVGDETYFNFLHHYYDSQYKWGSLTTAEFIDLVESFTGMDLDYFFDTWVYDVGRPYYLHSYYTEPDPSDGQHWVYHYVRQIQVFGPSVFTMPIDIKYWFDGGDTSSTVIFNDRRMQLFINKLDREPINARFDPNRWILSDAFDEDWTYHIIPFGLDTATQWAPYVDSLIARGGGDTSLFYIQSGALPPGMTLDTLGGIISGTPYESGTFTFTVYGRDYYAGHLNETREFTLTVESGSEPDLAGDVNLDEQVNILDIINLINYKYKDGPAPGLPKLADPNNDCVINILDIVFLINYKYKDGAEPVIGCA